MVKYCLRGDRVIEKKVPSNLMFFLWLSSRDEPMRSTEADIAAGIFSAETAFRLFTAFAVDGRCLGQQAARLIQSPGLKQKRNTIRNDMSPQIAFTGHLRMLT